MFLEADTHPKTVRMDFRSFPVLEESGERVRPPEVEPIVPYLRHQVCFYRLDVIMIGLLVFLFVPVFIVVHQFGFGV